MSPATGHTALGPDTLVSGQCFLHANQLRAERGLPCDIGRVSS